ncbi:MAG: AsmA family protein [Magnetococcus sp. THC-1_WYH]
MKRIAVRVVAGLALLAVLVFTALFAVPPVLDSNAIKGQIARIIQEKTGHPLIIDGDLRFSFFPSVTITIGHAHVDNPDGFSQSSMVVFRGAELTVSGFGLMLGHLDVVELAIDDLEVALERREDGIVNWSDGPGSLIDSTLLPELGELAGIASSDDGLTLQIGLSGMAAVSMGGVNLSGAKISWNDRKKGQQYSLENIAVVSRSLGGGVTGLELNGHWKWLSADTQGRVSLNYEIHGLGDRLKLNDVHLFLSSQSQQALLRESECRVTTGIIWDMKGGHLAFNELEVGATGWFTQYSLRDLDMVLKGAAEWDLNKASVTMANARLALKARSDDLPPTGISFLIRSGLAWERKTGNVTLSGLHAEGPANMRLKGDLVVQGIADGLSHIGVKGQVATEPFDPKALFVAMGQQLPHVIQTDELSQGAVSANFQADAQGIVADSIQVAVDDTHMEGNFSWRHQDLPEIRFDLSFDQVNMDRYWDLLAGAGNVPDHQPLAAMLLPEFSLAGLLRWLPGDWDLDGSLRGQQMQVSGANLADLNLHMNAAGGVLTLDPFQFALYQGAWKQKIRVDHARGDPRLLVEKEMKGVQLQPFLAAMAGVDWLTGTMDLSGQVETSGRDFASARKNLKGSYWLGVKNGGLHGIDLTGTIRDIAATVDGRKPQKDDENKEVATTVVSELTATVRVGEGRVVNSDLLAVSDSVVVKGQGEADLLEMTVDYTFSADAQAALKGMDIPYWDRLEGVVLPIHVVGPLKLLNKPTIGDPQLTRSLMAARQNHQSGGIRFGGQPFADVSQLPPVADDIQRNRHPMTRFKRGLFPP